MANVYGTTKVAPIFVRALQLAIHNRPLISRIATDANMLGDVSRAKKGDTIKACIHTVPAVADYSDGTAATGEAADTDVDLVLSGFKEVGRTFTAAELQEIYDENGNADRDVIDELANPLATSIGNHIVDQIAATWTKANFPQASAASPASTAGSSPQDFRRYVKAASSMDFAALADMFQICDQGAIPNDDRFVCLNSAAYTALLKDSTASLRATNTEDATITGELRGLCGFQSIVRHASLNTANTHANLVGFFGSKDSVIFATRVPSDPSQIAGVPVGANYQVIVEPKTGIRVLLMEWITPGSLALNVKACWLQGYAKGNPANGMLITAA